jgi:hypothetical protein
VQYATRGALKSNCVVAQADFTLVQNFYFFVTRLLTKMCNTNSSCNSSSNNNIIVKSKKDRICLLIDIAIPSDVNVIQKEAEKI